VFQIDTVLQKAQEEIRDLKARILELEPPEESETDE
ncbi:unnamed protein product, partial [marine sediment metagenome]